MTQSDERGAEMRELFFETAQELLQSLNEDALKLERDPADAELVRSIRRSVHTIKGDAAACGFRELSNAAHELEDVLALESASSFGSLAEVTVALESGASWQIAHLLTAYCNGSMAALLYPNGTMRPAAIYLRDTMRSL